MAYDLLVLSSCGESKYDVEQFCIGLHPTSAVLHASFHKDRIPSVPPESGAYIDVEAWAGSVKAFLDVAGVDVLGPTTSRTIAVGYSDNANRLAALTACTDLAIEGAILIRPTAAFDRVPSKPLNGLPMLVLSGIHDPLAALSDVALLGAQLSMAGADVTQLNLLSGHGISRRDRDACVEWLTRLRTH